MRSQRCSKTLLSLFVCVLFTFQLFAQKNKSAWKSLFNGKDLSNWDTYLRATNVSGYVDDTTLPYQAPIGLNNDPLKVFTISNGILRISGEIWGAITTKQEYSNYHLRFETKWGQQKYAPKDKSLRDGGVLFHCTEGFDYAFKCWMRSMEMQVQETEIGDFFNVGAGDAEFQSNQVKTLNNETAEQYNPAMPLKRYPGRVYRSGDFESAPGEWTTSELVARQADAVFIVNGFVVNRLFNIYRQDLLQQVTTGKLQFQSEGAEHFYRKIEIRPISFQSAKPILKPASKEVVITPGVAQQISIKNTGDAVEIIAVELLGKEIEEFVVKLPPLPLVLKKDGVLSLPVSVKPGTKPGHKVKFRLETVLGPVPDFQVQLTTK